MGQRIDRGVTGAGYLQTKFKNVVKKRLHGALRKTSGKRRLSNERTLRLLNPPAQQGILKSDARARARARARATRKLMKLYEIVILDRVLFFWYDFVLPRLLNFVNAPKILLDRVLLDRVFCRHPNFCISCDF